MRVFGFEHVESKLAAFRLVSARRNELESRLHIYESANQPGARDAIYVQVDRIASAWLIRRFIDVEARFKFVAARGYKPKRGELRFDMFEAEYTHVGGLHVSDAC